MGLTTQDVVRAGQWVMGETLSGWNIDLFSTITPDDVVEKARKFAEGWTPEQADIQRNIVVGIGGTLRIFGRATSDMPTAVIRSQMENAIDDFWSVAGATVQVYVSDSAINPSDVPKAADQWPRALQWAAAAVIVVAIAWGIYQIRKVIE